MPNLKLAFRSLARTPFVTTVAIVSLALGMGANGAIFSLYEQMLMRPLPVPEPDRLVNLAAPGPKSGSTSCNSAGGCDQVFSYPMFRDLEREQTVLTGLAAHRSFGANFAASDGKTSSGAGMLVSGSYFPTLDVRPALGRLLGPGDDPAVGEARVAVLSHDAWHKRFGGRPDVIGETLRINGQPLEIVGVAPEGFSGTTLGIQPEVFVPITLRGLMAPGFDGFEDRRSYWAYVFGRLRPGVDSEQAHGALNGIYRGILEEVEAPLQEGMSAATLARFRVKEVTLEPGGRGQSGVHAEARAPLRLLFAVAGVVLLIACANVANLLLARSAARRGEIAVRLSIGAGRRRLVGQLLTEAGLLATAGAALGLAVAYATMILIGGFFDSETRAAIEPGLDGSKLAFFAAMALLTTVLFGLYPALHSTRLDLASTLKGVAGQPAGARAAVRFRTGLLMAQITLATALLVAAGLFTKSLYNIGRVELGLEVDNLVTFEISPELSGETPERSRQLFVRLEEALAALPGVSGVTGAMVAVLAGNSWGSNVRVEGLEPDPDADHNARFNLVGPGYFRVLGMTLLAGREFTDADVVDAPKVAIVNQSFAERFGLGRDAVGKRMGIGGEDEGLDVEIVGLVRDAKYNYVKDPETATFFLPYRQDPDLGFLSFYVRTALPPEEMMAAIPPVVARLAPDLPVDELKTMRTQVRENVASDRFLATLSAAFAALATLLAAVGLYGVSAYTVAQRRRELGLRMALGADRGRVLRMVLWQVGRLAIAGAAVGLAAAFALGRVARSLLYGLEGHDPVVLAGAAFFLALVVLLSGLVPAHRASRIDPMRALRYE